VAISLRTKPKVQGLLEAYFLYFIAHAYFLYFFLPVQLLFSSWSLS